MAHTLDLMVQRAYAVMNNDVLISVPLFVFMGYLVERANLIERLFKSLHLATARIPGSLAVATVVTCAIFATATGIIGAVVTLMGLLAFPAMLKAGYNVRLAAGAVTAGGTLGILIPPSVLLILYGATAGVSVVQLYAGAFFPGIMLAALYVLWIVIIYAKIKPSIAPPLSEEDQRVTLPKFAEVISRTGSSNVMMGLIGAIKGKRNADVPLRTLINHLVIALLPALAVALLMGSIYLAVTAPDYVVPAELAGNGLCGGGRGSQCRNRGLEELRKPAGCRRPRPRPSQEAPAAAESPKAPAEAKPATPPAAEAAPAERKPVPTAYWVTLGIVAAGLAVFYAIFTFVRLEIFKMLLASFFPLALLILGVLGSIVVGLATPTEAAAMGSFGGFVLAAAYRQLNFDRGQGIGLPLRQDQRHGVLAVRRLEHLRRGVRAARRPGDHQCLGEVARHDAGAIHAPGAGHHLPARLAAGVDRDHRHLHADLHPAAVALQHRSALLRPAGGAQPADSVPVAAGGDGRVLPEGRGAAARDAEPDLPGDDAVHGDPGARDIPAVHVPGRSGCGCRRWCIRG